MATHGKQFTAAASQVQDRPYAIEEAIPLMQQYICLDRVGAPQVLKDHVYGELQRALAPQHLEE